MKIEERATKLLKELISINSVSGKEESIQRFLESKMKHLGLDVKRQEVEGNRFNLLYSGKSPVLISCHVDTVPPIGMKEAFKPKEKGGRIYGRGASDVKGALASLLTAIEVFREKYPQEELPVSLALVVDEENNSALGSEKAKDAFPDCRFCLVLEPTYGVLCTSQSGSLEFSVKIEGEGAHAAEFEKVENPIKVCMYLIDLLESRLNRPVNVISIKGGSRNYTVPKSCYALMEVKVFEEEKWEEIEGKIKECIKGMDTKCKIYYELEDAENFIKFRKSGLLDLLKDVFRESIGEEPDEGIMPSWTDAANYHRAGLSCVVFGYGSLKDSHTERESISIDDLGKMVKFFLGLLERLR